MIASTVVAITRFHNFYLGGYDDALITFRYVRRFAEGRGYNFSSIDQTGAASAPGWSLLLYISNHVTSDFTVSAIVMSFFALFVLVFSASYYLYGSRAGIVGAVCAQIVLIPLVFDGRVQYWSVSGMETIVWMTLVVVVIVRVGFKQFSQHDSVLPITPAFGWLSGSLAAVAGFFRVDSVVYITIVLGSAVMVSALTRTRIRVDLKSAILGALIGMCAQFALNSIIHNDLLQNPRRHKGLVNYYDRTFDEGKEMLVGFLSYEYRGLFILLSGISILALSGSIWMWRKSRLRSPQISAGIGSNPSPYIIEIERSKFYPYLAIVASSFMAISVLAPRSDNFRYEMTLLGVGYLVLAIVTSDVVAAAWRFTSSVGIQSATAQSPRILVRYGAVLLLLLPLVAVSNVLLQGDLRRSVAASNGSSWSWYLQDARHDAGVWASLNVPEGHVAVSSDIGALSFRAWNVEFLDAAGLTSRSVLTGLESSTNYGSAWPVTPTYLIDSGSVDGVTGVETIWNAPSAYFANSNLASVCTFRDAFRLELKGRWPIEDGHPLYVFAFKLTPTDLYERCVAR